MNALLAEVVEAFGNRFVRWTLNMGDGDQDIDADIQLTAEQSSGISQLLGLARTVLSAQYPMERNLLRKRILVASSSGLQEEVLPTVIRRRCDGSLPAVESSDELMSLLLKLVRDVFPVAVLLREEPVSPMSNDFWEGVFLTFGLQAASELIKLILVDEQLKQLFPEVIAGQVTEANRYDVQSYVKWSSGSGGSYSLVMVPDALVSYAIVLGRIREPFSIESAMTAAREGLSLARRLAAGEEVDVPLIADVENVALGTDSCVEFGHEGALYPMSKLSPKSSTALTFVTPVEEQVQQVAKYESGGGHLAIKRTWSEAEQRELTRRFLRVSRRLDRLRLAIILSSLDGHIVSPVISRWRRLNPLTVGGATYGEWEGTRSPFPPGELSSGEQTAMTWWFGRLGEIDTASLDVGIRRLISAITSRLDPLDGFIDAVMCWENLFSGAPETTFKVCGSLAKLLEPVDAVARLELFSRAKKLYGARSTLVHGGVEPEPNERDKLRNDAVKLAMSCLAAVLQNDALLRRNTSSRRADYILVGV